MSTGLVPTTLTGELADLVQSASLHGWPNEPELWQRLQVEAPIAWNGPYLVLSGYENVRLGLRDRRFGKMLTGSTGAAATAAALPPGDRALLDELIAFESLWIVRTPTEEAHDRLRRIMHRIFTPRAIEEMRESVDRHTDELLDDLAAQGGETADFAPFGYRLPLRVIADLLGVPSDDREQVHEWSLRISEGLSREPQAVRASVAAVREFRMYVDAIVDRHRQDPDAVVPLVQTLLDAQEEERLSPEELTAAFVQLLFAGHETTSALLQQGLIELMAHREQWELLCREPDRIPNAIEELLRWVPPVAEMWRVAHDDCDLLGIPIERGQSIRLLIAAANRDPSAFENPGTFDVTRPDASQHLSFGFGARFCLGVSLARLEAATALAKLTRRFPNMELATDELDAQRGPGLRTLPSIPVRLNSKTVAEAGRSRP